MYFTLINVKGKRLKKIMGFGRYKAEKAVLPSIEEKGDYKVPDRPDI